MTRLEVAFNLWRSTWGLSEERACRLLNLSVVEFSVLCDVFDGTESNGGLWVKQIYHQNRTMRNAHCVIGRVRYKMNVV